MKRGLVLGKFMPLHKGHIALIEFALDNCDELIVLICVSNIELITGAQRLEWVEKSFTKNNKIKPVLLAYDESYLPNTSESSEEVSKVWAKYLKEYLPAVNIFFASEAYAVYMGKLLNCEYKIFDLSKNIVPVSSTQIRQSPFTSWDFIPPAVRPYYTKKICLYATESTGKTTMTKKLARYFNTIGVTEMARNIIENTYECTEQHLIQIAELHAQTINEKIYQANKLLFVDTDVNITRSYSKFLFKNELKVRTEVALSNTFELYLYLDTDAPYVQDGTRLSKIERDVLNDYHKAELINRNICFEMLSGTWDEKFQKAVKLVQDLLQPSRTHY